jgi:hypothetical protein
VILLPALDAGLLKLLLPCHSERQAGLPTKPHEKDKEASS